jgi:hypothetical protein
MTCVSDGPILLLGTSNVFAVVHRSGIKRPLAAVAVVKKASSVYCADPHPIRLVERARSAATCCCKWARWDTAVGTRSRRPRPASLYAANGQQDRIVIRDDNAAGLDKNKQKNSYPCSSCSFTTSPVFWMLWSPRRRRTGRLGHSRVVATIIYEPRKGMIDTRRAASRTMAPPGGSGNVGDVDCPSCPALVSWTNAICPSRMTRSGCGIQQSLLVDCPCLHSFDGWIDQSRSLLRNVLLSVLATQTHSKPLTIG